MEYIVGKARMEFLVRALFGRLGKRSLIAIAEAPDDGGGAFLDFPRLLVTLSEALEAFEDGGGPSVDFSENLVSVISNKLALTFPAELNVWRTGRSFAAYVLSTAFTSRLDRSFCCRAPILVFVSSSMFGFETASLLLGDTTVDKSSASAFAAVGLVREGSGALT